MNRWIFTALVASLCAFIGSMGERIQTRRAIEKDCGSSLCLHFVLRKNVALTQAATLADRPRYLALGDSFLEGASLPELCGRAPVNAGLSGANAADLARFAPELVAGVRPDFVLLSVGANDLLQGRETFAADLAGLMAKIGPVPVYAMELAPTPRLAAGGPINAALRRSATMVPALAPGEIVSPDQLHLDGATYVRFNETLAPAICEDLARRLPA